MLATTPTPSPPLYRTKRGRPRKVGVKRHPVTGKSLGPDIELMWTQPHRRPFMGMDDPEKRGEKLKVHAAIMGYPLGRLFLAGHVSRDQHEAGNEWARVVRAYGGIMGIPMGSVKSGSDHPEIGRGEMEASSMPPVGTEEYEKRVGEIRERYNGCFERLAALGRSLGVGNSILIACRRVCVEEIYPSDREVGSLRQGLNALCLHLGVEGRGR